MAMEIWFLRHGETEWNAERRIQGSTAWTDLTGEGVRLAEETARAMAEAGVTFDRAYTSPYLRAARTARIVCGRLGLEPVADARLREMSFGRYEGTLIGEGRFADANIRSCFLDPPSYVPDGGETFDEVAARVRDFVFGEMAPLEGSVRRVLAVAHGVVLRTAVRLATGAPLGDFWRGAQPNCCVHVFSLAGGRLSLVGSTFPPMRDLDRFL